MGIVQVARQAGVSITTVSRVFNAPKTVAEATRAAVHEAANAQAYLPNATAATLRTQRSRALGVLLPTLLNPVFAECLAGIAQAAADAGYAIIPLTTSYDEAQEAHAVRQLMQRAVDGVILTVANAAYSATLKALKRDQLPYVLAYNRHPRHPCVSVNGEAAMVELIEHLQRSGHSRITMVCGTLEASDRAQQRHAGYTAAMQRAGLSAECIEVPFVESAVDVITARLRLKRLPTALVCSNDLLAVRCLRAAALAGLRVPADISVVGFDGIALGADLTPSLASIAQPNQELGSSSAAWLIGCLLEGVPPKPRASLTLPHTLLLRESVAAVH